MSAEKKSYTRWHDRQPQLAQVVRILSLMPDEVCGIIGESMLQLMYREYKEILLDKQFRTIGSEKIMGLHKSKNKRREYDQNETLHKAMNTLFLLPEEGRAAMADHIMIMLNYIKRYLSACHEFKQASSPDDIGWITKQYVDQGSEEVESFLQNLRETFYLNFHISQSAQVSCEEPGIMKAASDAEANTTTKDNMMGLRIKRIRLN